MFPHSPGFLTSQTALFFQFAFLGGSRSLLWLHGIRQAVKKGSTSGEVPESGFQRTPASGRLQGLPTGWDNILDMVCAEWGLLWIKWQVWLLAWLQKCRLTHLYKVQPEHHLSYRASYFSFKHVFLPDQQKFSWFCWFTKSFTAEQTSLLMDILEIFHTRKFLHPLLDNRPSVDAFPIAGKEERERKNEERKKEHSDFYKRTTILVSICSPAAEYEVPSKNTTLRLGTPATVTDFWMVMKGVWEFRLAKAKVPGHLVDSIWDSPRGKTPISPAMPGKDEASWDNEKGRGGRSPTS